MPAGQGRILKHQVTGEDYSPMERTRYKELEDS